MKCRFEQFEIAGVASTVPAGIWPVQSLAAELGGTEVERIAASTGVHELRIAPASITTADLCASAARKLLAELQVAPETIDGIVFVSQTPDYILPTTSACLQHRLGLPKSAVSFDIPNGCSGYIQGLFQAGLLLNSLACQQVLICAGDTIARLVNPRDRSVRTVFGDAGSATLVRRGPSPAHFVLHTDGSGADKLIVPAGGCRLPRSAETAVAQDKGDGNWRSADDIFMNGIEVMNFALREVPRVLDEVLAEAGWSKDSVGLYGLHQANKFMIDYLARKARLPAGTAPVGLQKTGNTGPASIPLLLNVVRARLQPERLARSVLCGFGVGLAWGACAVNLASTRLLPPYELADGEERPASL